MLFEEMMLGRVVISRAGRDAGCWYIVIGKQKPPFLLLADGKQHTLASPKRKNIRHVILQKSVVRDTAEKLQGNLPVTDEEIRQSLQRLIKLANQRKADEEGISCPNRM